MEILTFAETAEKFGVSLATISRWVKTGKLEEGTKAGKVKTVTKKSVEFISSDQAFQIGLESLKKRPARIKVVKNVEEENELKRRIEQLENSMEKVTEGLENLQKITQRFIDEYKQNIENLCNFTQKKGENKICKKSKTKKNS